MESHADDIPLPADEADRGAAFGRALSLRLAEAAADEQAGVSRNGVEDPISPELALVDPELARAARALLPGHPPAAAISSPPAPRVRPAPVSPETDTFEEPAPRPARRRRRRAAQVGLAGLVLAGGALAGWLLADRTESQTGEAVTPTTRPATTSPPTSEPTGRTATTAARQTASTPATSASAPTRKTPAAVPAGRTFAWAPFRGASEYEFQLFRGGNRVFRARVAAPRLELPGRWRRAGRIERLEPGTYRWYVWPVSSRTGRQATVALVQAQLVVE
jgi:hypothetical protein